jgi:hypothetical protein
LCCAQAARYAKRAVSAIDWIGNSWVLGTDIYGDGKLDTACDTLNRARALVARQPASML